MSGPAALAISNFDQRIRFTTDADRAAFVAKRTGYDVLVDATTESLYLTDVRATQRLAPNDVAAMLCLFDPIGGWVEQSKPFSKRIKHPDRIFERVRQFLGPSRRSWLEYRGVKDEKQYSLRPPEGVRVCLVRHLQEGELLSTAPFFFQASGVRSKTWGVLVVTIRVALKGPEATIVSEYRLTIRGKTVPRADLPSGLYLGPLDAPEPLREPPLRIVGQVVAGLAFALPKATTGEVVLTAITDQGPASTVVEMTPR